MLHIKPSNEAHTLFTAPSFGFYFGQTPSPVLAATAAIISWFHAIIIRRAYQDLLYSILHPPIGPWITDKNF